MAANTPGVQLIPGVDGNPDMFSILGLDGSQNNTSLNGQQGGLSNIPRDAQVNTSVRTGYDIANGGFSGAGVNVTTFSGSNFIGRSMSGVFNAPQAQFNDRVGQASKYSYISVGGRASGALVPDKDFYTTSFQFDRRSQDLATLLNTSPLIFESAGHLERLRDALAIHSRNDRHSDFVRRHWRQFGAHQRFRPGQFLIGRLKVNRVGTRSIWRYNGGWSSTGPQAVATSQTPGSLGESRNWNGAMQLRHTNFFSSVLTESMLSASLSHNSSKPFLNLPGGSVLVTSTLDDGTATTRSLTFGGSAECEQQLQQIDCGTQHALVVQWQQQTSDQVDQRTSRGRGVVRSVE